MNSLFKILTVNILALVAFLPLGLQAQTISVAISVKEPTCFSWTDGEATATSSGGTAPYAYRWSNGQGAGQTVSGVPAGNYSVTVTDANNRETIKSFTVGQPPLLVPAITVIGNSCDVGASYTASGSGGVPPYTYAWQNLDTNQPAGTNATITAPTIGSYHVSVTDTKGCTMTKIVNVKPLKVMVIAKDATCGGTCDGSAEAWTDGGTAPYTYRWSNGSTTGIIFPIPGGSYTVTVTDALGCVRVATGTVFEPGILASNLTVSGQCSGSATATVTPTGGRAPLTVRWSTGATTNTVTNLTQGQYFVTVTDSAGCTKDTFFKVSTGILGLNITKTDASCSGVASGTATVNVTGGAIGAYTYRWNNGATTATISNLNAGTYTVTVTDGANCSSSQSVNIQSVSSLNLQTAFTNSVCGGSTGTATVTSVSGGTAPYAYRWSNGATTPSVSGLAAGNYTVTVTDASGCSATSGFVIQGQGNLSLTVASSPSTCGSTTGMATVTSVSGGTAPFTYRWNNGGTTQTITNIGVGTYYVTVADAAGCTASGVVEVQGTNALQVNVSTTKADCNTATGTATVNSVTGGTAPYTYSWSTGATTASVSGLPVGTYTVTVTDASGCSKATTIVINANSNLVLTTTTTPSVCGGATGSASVTSVTGGTAPYTYRWHNGGTTATISGLAAGPYFVTVTDAAGCARTSTVDVQSTSVFVLIPSSTNTTCNGSTGTATIDVTGSTGALIYRWSNGGTTKTISNLAAGTYTVTLTDASGCSSSASAQVEGLTTNFVINTSSEPSSCSGPTGSATVTSVTGGNAPYNYKWSNGATTSSISNLAAATYTVTVTDGSGCSQTKNITVAPVSTITARLDATNTACGLTTGIIVVANVSGGTGTYTYLWNNGATATTLTNLGAGIYTVTITDAAGCSVNASTTVKAIGNFDIKTTTTPSACVGTTGSATVTSVTGGNAPYTYKWSNGATTNSINNVAAGSYTVTVFDARNCESVSSIVVGTNSTVVTTPSVSNATCGKTNGAITLAPTGGTAPYTYTWADQTGTGQPRDRTNLRAGSYSVTINDAVGCSAILSSLKIVDTGSIKAQFALQPQGCVSNGDSVIMRLTNNTTAQSASFTSSWLLTGNRTSTDKSPDILYGTTESEARLIVRSAEGCLDTLLLGFPVDVIKVAITPTPTVTCVNTPVTVTATNQNPNFATTFLWDNGATTGTRTITPTAGGITRLILTTKNTYGCTRKDTVNVNTVAPLTPPDLSWKRACEPFKISFFDTNPNADQWRWNFGDATNGNSVSTAINPTYTYPNAGNYTVTVSPKTLACLNTLTLNVTVSDKPLVTVNAGRDTSVCSSDRITLKATGATNFEWSNSPTFTPVLGTGGNLLITPSSSGSSSFYVRSKDTMGLGCIAIDTIIVDNKTIRIDRTATVNLCGNTDKPLTITNLNAGDRLSVVWSPANVIVGYTNGDSLRPIVRSTSDVTLVGSYKNQFGCTLVDNMNLKATVFDAVAKANITAIYVNDVVTLTATPTGTGYTYAWSPTVNSPSSATTTVAPQTNGTYTVTVTNTATGCQDTGQVFLRVMVPQCDEPYIFIPRAFSPNGDGKNDLIYVRGDYLTSVEFVIFNRWGEQVFTTTDKSIGWDGKHRGEPVCPDVYGYYVKGVCQKGEQFFKKGNITVLK